MKPLSENARNRASELLSPPGGSSPAQESPRQIKRRRILSNLGTPDEAQHPSLVSDPPTHQPETGPLSASPVRAPTTVEQPASQKVFKDEDAFKVAVNNIGDGPLTSNPVTKRTKGQREAMGMPKTGDPTPRSKMNLLTGPRAVKRVEADTGRKLSTAEKRVVEVEGYVPHGYYDTKGNLSYGVGQTREHIGDNFTSSFDFHVDRAKGRIGEKLWESLPEYLTTELTQGEYRGDLGLSPKTIRLIKGGEFDRAATEFLNNDEYKSTKTEQGVKDRMKAISDALRQHSKRK